MPLTPLQTVLHNLQEGVAVNVDLKDYMSTPGESFKIVSTTRAWNEADLPDGLSLSSVGVLSGTPAAGSSSAGARGDGVYSVRVRAEKGARDPDASWAARTAGAINAERFDLDSCLDGSGASGGSKTGIGGATQEWTTRDTTYYRSGGSSLKQILPAGVGGLSQAAWVMPTYPQTQPWLGPAQGIAPGEALYFQFSIRPGREYVLWPWDTTPKIKALVMLPTTGPGVENEWVNASWSAFNSQAFFINRSGAIHGQYNGPSDGHLAWETFLGPPYSDYTQHPEIDNGAAYLNGVDPGFADGSGQDAAWTARQQYRAQHGPLWRYYSNNPFGANADGVPDPIGGYPFLPINGWFTTLIRAQAGVPGTNTARLEYWIAHEGQGYVKIFDSGLFALQGNGTAPYWTDGGRTSNECWTAFMFFNNPYLSDGTGKPETHHHMDELIVSSSYIPAPDFEDGTGTYRTSDAIITMRIAP